MLLLTGVTVGLSRLEPAAPTVEKAATWTDTVKRGEMLRQVRGTGSLVPEQILYVLSDTDGRIERINVLAGAEVQEDTVLLKLSNPELEQSVFDLEWQLKAAQAQMTKLQAQQESDRLTQQVTAASLKADWEHAELEAEANEALARDGLAAVLDSKRYRVRANDLRSRYQMELKKLETSAKSATAQLAVQTADLEKLRASLELKRKKLEGLEVRAGVDGVLQQIGDRDALQIGQRISSSTTLAKIVQPAKLKAEVKIAETQVKDVLVGQRAMIDTHNGIIPGRVTRVDPAVQNGTVTVDVKLEGELPKGARPDLSVDGTIELERLENVLHVGRPVHGQQNSTVGIFKLVNGGKEAVRVPVKFGRSSVSTIEIQEGLSEGDQVILSDMSQWDTHDKVRLN
ncbi:MAG: HlyD family efflux transporter periplasmic adaptor subunit [Verrucomicrobiota bacterium]